MSIEEWGRDEPFFDAKLAKVRSKGRAQVGIAQPRRILSNADGAPVHTSPSSSDVILGVYENGVVVSGLRGASSLSALAWFGLIPSFCMILIGIYCAHLIIKLGEGFAQEPGLALGIGCAGLFGLFFGFSTFSVLFRGLVLMPSDFPVIFNRETKEVWVSVPKMPSFIRVFELHPVSFECHSWARLHPRIYRVLEFTPGMSSARWAYILTLVFGREGDPTKVVSEVNVGFKGWGDDFELLQLWEHIRRYMNDAGPALDQGEKFKTFSTGRLPKFPDEAMAALGRKLSESEAWEITGA